MLLHAPSTIASEITCNPFMVCMCATAPTGGQQTMPLDARETAVAYVLKTMKNQRSRWVSSTIAAQASALARPGGDES
jgi:hypothetical protein